MKKPLFLLACCLLLLCTLTLAQTREILFDVLFKDETVGLLHAQEKKSKSKSYKVLTIDTKTTFLFIPIHVESEVTTTHRNGVLIEGTAYRNASRNSSDVVATVKKIGPRRYRRILNGVKDKIRNQRITVCVIDLYFKEPVGVTQVFSNMYTQMLDLKLVGGGRYQLTTPDNNDSFYVYRNGELTSIEVDTIMGDVSFRRK